MLVFVVEGMAVVDAVLVVGTELVVFTGLVVGTGLVDGGNVPDVAGAVEEIDVWGGGLEVVAAPPVLEHPPDTIAHNMSNTPRPYHETGPNDSFNDLFFIPASSVIYFTAMFVKIISRGHQEVITIPVKR